jgi:hypothetical protein
MKDEMPNIDTSGIETLKELKAEQDVIRERIDKMTSMKDKVSEQVFNKVHTEYAGKLDAIQEQAEPLKNKIRGQYAVLKDIVDGVQTELSTLELEKEEFEFRNTLGEFEEDAFQEQMEKWKVRHMEKQAEMEELENLKTEFLSAFDSPDDLEIKTSLETIPVTTRPPTPAAEPEVVAPEDEAAFIAEEAEAPSLEETADLSVNVFPQDPDPIPEDPEPVMLPELDTVPTEDGEIETDLDELSLEEKDAELSVETDEPDLEEMELGEDLETDTEDIEPVEDADELTDEFEVDMSDTDLGDLEELETELEESSEPTIEPPPLPDPAALDTRPNQTPPNIDGTVKDLDPPTFEHERTLLADRLTPTPEGSSEDPEGTMIISNPKIVSLKYHSSSSYIFKTII